jgi:hypothetical protein
LIAFGDYATNAGADKSLRDLAKAASCVDGYRNKEQKRKLSTHALLNYACSDQAEDYR